METSTETKELSLSMLNLLLNSPHEEYSITNEEMARFFRCLAECIESDTQTVEEAANIVRSRITDYENE